MQQIGRAGRNIEHAFAVLPRFQKQGMMAMIRILIIAPMESLIVSLSSVCFILLVFPSVFLYNNGRRCRHGS